MQTITRRVLNEQGWICPGCGMELIRVGGPNEPEFGICYNDDCDTSRYLVVEEA